MLFLAVSRYFEALIENIVFTIGWTKANNKKRQKNMFGKFTAIFAFFIPASLLSFFIVVNLFVFVFFFVGVVR